MAREGSKLHPTHDDIARRAYEIFVERGRPEGRDMEHWLEAEQELKPERRAEPAEQAETVQPRASSRPANSAPRSQRQTSRQAVSR